ncbi:hypothetical protein GALL_88160 [mine drainage metagenome]|uniref:Endo-1,3-beta-glucanase btgC n=1 Tax=mine drainage metagenome TaxID=410659 RepID=A0A1J5SL62_9ZZZZ
MLLMAALAVWQGRPVPVPEPPLQRLGCVSFAHPESALVFGRRPPVRQADLERELTRLRPWTDCIRIYSSDPRQAEVLPLARKLGLKVLLGAWINSHADTSHADLDSAIALARRYPGTVTALVVGNEVLTVKEMPIAALLPYLDEARRRSPVPVTIAEVWSVWLTYPQLADHVDFIGAHILPYWDGAPLSLPAALAEVETALQKVERRFPGKPILIAETGWPSGGRAKGGLAPGQVEQARFVRGVAALAARHGWRINLVEAYDQPWKRIPEGVAGGTWGLFDSAGRPKFAFAGAAVPERRWPLPLATTLLLGLWGGWRYGRRAWRAAALAPVLGALVGWQSLFLLDWVAGWGRAALALALLGGSLRMAWRGLRALARTETLAIPPPWAVAALWRRPGAVARALAEPGGLLCLYQCGALLLCLGESWQGPSDYYSLVLASPALAAALTGRAARPGPWSRRFGLLLALGGPFSIALSGGVVLQAWCWALVVLGLALPLLRRDQPGASSVSTSSRKRSHSADRSTSSSRALSTSPAMKARSMALNICPTRWAPALKAAPAAE